MSAAVYNRYWSTGGGAETYGGAVAQLLARRGPVQLLAHEELDLDRLGERLSLDLSGCTVRVVPQTSRAVTAASRDVELFVNVSHRSREAGAARRNVYVVHFPTSMSGLTAAPSSAAPRVEWGPGFHGREGRTTWTDGAGTLLVTTAPGQPVDLTVLVGFARPAAAGPTEVRLLVDGRELTSTQLATASPVERWSGRALRAQVVSPAPGVPVQVVVASDGFVPGELVGGDDTRTLGVPVVGVALGRDVWAARVTRRAAEPGTSTEWLDGYDALVANSAFTAGWVQRLWQRPATVLHPPVPMRPAGAKEQSILSVGRFFPTGRGHSKKQVELVQAFRQLVDGGLTDWTLHLVGGCADDGRGYLHSVQEAAADYPVEVHPNALGSELDALYARASVYWHAAGLGEDADADPDRLEHFGISTVEAMSAGAVPVVLGAGGLVETVRDGVDGLHFSGLEDLVARTRELAEDPERLAAMSASAAARAREFSLDAFDARLEELLGQLSTG